MTGEVLDPVVVVAVEKGQNLLLFYVTYILQHFAALLIIVIVICYVRHEIQKLTYQFSSLFASLKF